METKKRLSLCMILYNEELFLENCLNSVLQYVDEIVIVDTGSTDRTKEICQSFGAQIYDFPWNGSFAQARNYGIERATGEWILYLDADEELVVKDESLWNKMLQDDKHCILGIPIINYYGDRHIDSNKAYLLAQYRLFRNGLGLRFENDIHEQLIIRKVLEDFTAAAVLPAVLHHYGYLDSVATARNKHERNMSMLTRARDESDHNPWIDYHIASEYYRLKDYTKAFEQVNISIQHFINQGQIPPSILYKLKYDSLLANGSFDQALAGIDKVIALYPDYVDMHFYKGVILFVKKRYAEAETVFQTCQGLGESHLQHLTLKGTGSFQALYYIGRCREMIEDWNIAAQCYKGVLLQCPNHAEALEGLERLAAVTGRFDPTPTKESP
ncbi:glycosyltransferase [Paenibacillus jiagnxiensis]|uniref:glycosyltransferase n=1 Tax=Paenibacillus jiagnxiensis TaxID=3228926 RepID=UPI0033B23235